MTTLIPPSLLSLGMLEFLGATQKQLTNVCHDFDLWQQQMETLKEATVVDTESMNCYQNHGTRVIRAMLLGVQRMMNRHFRDKNTFKTASGSSDGRLCVYIYDGTLV